MIYLKELFHFCLALFSENLEQAVDFKKPVYEQVLKIFSPYILTDADERNCFERRKSRINFRQQGRKFYTLKQ